MGEPRGKEAFALLGGAAVIVAVGVGLLADAAAVAEGIRGGLQVCGNVLIPSLFPFMVLAGFISRTRYAELLSRPLAPVTRRLYRLPGDMGAIVLLSLIGGYPVGARMVANLLEDGRIRKEDAERMLCFCVNSGPSFLISAVGVGMLGNRRLGVLLFATQTAATLIVGYAVSRRSRVSAASVARQDRSGATAFVSAVSGAASSMMAMCAWAILFSAVVAMLQAYNVPEAMAGVLSASPALVAAVLSGFFEVTTGCLGSAGLGGITGFALISMAASWSGLSVLFQVMSCFGGERLRFRKLILARCAHVAVALGLALPLYRILGGEQAVWMPLRPSVPPVMHTDNRTLMLSFCLLAMCSILVLSTGKRK